jgi:hypothetical protein
MTNVNDGAEGSPPAENLKAAVDAVMDSEPLTRRTNAGGKPGKPAAKQFLLRMTQEEHEEWRSFSDSLGVSMAEMTREAVRFYISEKRIDPDACRRTDCEIVTYPWGTTICKKCDKRF